MHHSDYENHEPWPPTKCAILGYNQINAPKKIGNNWTQAGKKNYMREEKLQRNA